MALIFSGQTECPLCRKVIAKDDEVVATTHFIADQTDSFWQYSDAAFHKTCFDAWEHQEEFWDRYQKVRNMRGFT